MKNVIIMGAAGRDFHNFNTYFRDNPNFKVVAFTATQIPDIAGRKYPAVLAGKMYPDGIPIFPEEELTDLIRKNNVTKVYFSYSDTSHEYVMHRASQVQAAGASFILLGPVDTMVKSVKPVISICAVRTGCGKSQTTRKVGAVLIAKGRKVAAIRHPMPYGDLAVQKVQRFAAYEDLDKHHCTIEEREEYEPHIKAGIIVYAGVDYEAILREAEKEADVILWDGGNNDFPFYKSDLEIVVVDPHRAGHELLYYPGETNFRRAQVIVINKMDTAPKEGVDKILENIKAYNPGAIVIKADSPTHVENGEQIRGKRVLVVEDGPTVTHGGMPFGAGVVTAEKYGAGELVDPRPFAVESIAATYAKYPHMVKILPAMGYGEKQVADLAATIDKVDCDLIISATPIDLNRLIKTRKPMLPVGYDLQEIGSPTIEDVLQKF
ncbi:MAG: cyclic 2,3-diphosphoglycerate synthase [Acidobacteriota bacterium]|jgi:Predicted GTPase|nr:GTPase [Acidobacteriota bacterium]HOF82491.1 cyclic 2,3-diphosphoglycerate synthase [Candidatus Aminicenantes bacterium]MDD8009710.1 cyclic 2,3-diphosphoglycerate synthase [Acidobacteriota bacterium]MDD8028391.1 cyclic 2,3-diphosphoglycerate synthase [Acidobacteriota bacterium]MDD8032542.1 cyclic 2,3-diphosphoglycerate synthase [Acidobacteriota bacterium]